MGGEAAAGRLLDAGKRVAVVERKLPNFPPGTEVTVVTTDPATPARHNRAR